MPRIEPLLEKLKTETKVEGDMFRGAAERQFFIEVFPAGSVDELLDEYTPDAHNSEWDAERQKPAPEPDKIMKSRRAIAFMYAGKKGMHKHYKETELRLHVMGRARMIRNDQFLANTEYFVKLDSYKKGE